MLYFPQLMSGATAQYPLTRIASRRTIVNDTAGGRMVKLDDPDAAGVAWDLRYSGLNDTERTALENLFVRAEGRLLTFAFLDPTANLLRWSEDFDQAVWLKDGGIAVSGTRLTNAAGIVQGIRQVVQAPAAFSYCLSAEVLGETASAVTVSLGDGAVSSNTIAGVVRQRVFCSGSVGGAAEQITCSVELAAGASVDVLGMQLEAQPYPSAYRRTRARGGVYERTRFVEDELSFVAHGLDDHAVAVRLYSHTGAGA